MDAASGGTADLPLLCGEKNDPVSEDLVEYVVRIFEGGWRRQYAAIRADYGSVLVQDAAAGASLARSINKIRSESFHRYDECDGRRKSI